MMKFSNPDIVFRTYDDEDGVVKLKTKDDIRYFNLSGLSRLENGHYISSYNSTYHYTFNLEEKFDGRHYVKLMYDYKWLSYLIITAYIVCIFALKRYMLNKPRFEIRIPLFLWNLSLAIFSIAGAIRCTTEIVQLLWNFGFKFSVCFSGKPMVDNHVVAFWFFVFTISKIVELGATLFIVLRKQPLIFLHWYHHVTVLWYVWYCFLEFNATARWFAYMNFCVHSVMYTYYAVKALRFRVPRWIAMSITVAQISQMIMGIIVNVTAYQMKEAGNNCHVSYDNIRASMLMYISYFILFVMFFARVYFSAKPKPFKESNNNYIDKSYKKE